MKVRLIILCALVLSIAGCDIATATTPLWKDAELKLVDSYLVGQPTTVRCHGIYEYRQIAGEFESHNICMSAFSPKGIQTGLYILNGNVYHVVGFRGDPLVYRFGGCESYDNCIYLPAQDMLVRREHLINNIVRSLVIYKNFSDRLIRSDAINIFDRTYSFRDNAPDFILQSQAGYPWPVIGMGASNNGRWLGVQLRERGYAFIDTDDFSMRRLTNDKTSSGTEIAISDAGDAMAIVGWDFGQRVIDINDECGDTPIEWMQPLPDEQSCSSRYIWTDPYGGVSFLAEDPNFDSTGTVLSFSILISGGVLQKIYLSRDTTSTQQVEYLALGDSFSSGEGEIGDQYYLEGTNQAFHKCHTSTRSYPFVVNISSLTKSVACSGAQIHDVVGVGDNYWGQGDRLGPLQQNLTHEQRLSQQLVALNTFLPGVHLQEKFVERYRPEILTIGIGGNDAGLMSKLQACLMPGICEWASDATYRQRTAEEIGRLFDMLSGVYQHLRTLSPNTKIFAVGYPKVIEPSGNCSLVIGTMLEYEERVFMDESIKYLNQVIKAAAMRSGVGYIDIEDSLAGHRLCQDGEPAINTLRLGEEIAPIEQIEWAKVIGAESFHPTPLGHQLIAVAMKTQLDNESRPVCLGQACGQIVQLPRPSAYWGYAPENPQSIIQLATDMIRDGIVTIGESDLFVDFAEGTFAPESLVRVSVHSTPVDLGEYQAGPSGELRVQLSFPDAVQPGIHTLHVEGTLGSGRQVDMYQTIFVSSPDTIHPPIEEIVDLEDVTPEDVVEQSKVSGRGDSSEAWVLAPPILNGRNYAPGSVLSSQDSVLASVSPVSPLSFRNLSQSKENSWSIGLLVVLGMGAISGIVWIIVRYTRSNQ